MYEYIQVFLVDMPVAVKGLTVKNSDNGFTILINAGLSDQAQIAAYDHEMEHINNNDYDHFCNIDALEALRHSA